MMDIDRRGILGATVALPTWLSIGFTPAAAMTAPGRMQSALERARGLGKPLLVLLVPEEAVAVTTRGELWGCYFANLSDPQALDLSLCEVTCARAGEIEEVSKASLKSVDATTWGFLLETDVDPARAVAVRGALPGGGSLHGEHGQLSDDTSGLRSALEKLLHAALLPDDATQARRLAQCRPIAFRDRLVGIFEADKSDVESIMYDPPLRRGDLDRFAALVRFGSVPNASSSSTGASTSVRRLSLLADAVRIRLFESAPDGATWMLYAVNCPTCGMGHISPASRFFLKFLTQ